MRSSRSRSIVLKAPGEEVDHAVDALAIVLLGDVPDAGRLAALDVVVQARAAAAPPRLGAGAGAEHEHLREHLQRAAHALGVRVRAEVRPARAVALAREVHARVVLVERDRDERVGLVVAQADVEARPVLLDEALLGQQRLGLAGHDHALDPLHARHHLRVTRAAPPPAPWRSATPPACGSTSPCPHRSRGPSRRGTGRRRAGRAGCVVAQRGSIGAPVAIDLEQRVDDRGR